MKHLHLQIHAERYAELRKALGFKFRVESSLLQQFVRFLESQDSSGPVRAAMALEWAVSASPLCGRCGQVQRLTVARHFLIYLKAFLPDTEIPASGLLAEERRPRPYLYSDDEIVRMQQTTRTVWEPGCLKQITFETLIGLLASTGLRIGEALRLTLGDLHLDVDPPHLEIRNTKFGKSRFVPVHPSTARNLRIYLDERHKIAGDKPEALFLLRPNKPLRYPIAQCYFKQIIRAVGVPKNQGRRGPAWHSLRHSFAVRCLLMWYRAGSDVRSLLPNLAVYLGHVGPAQTYHYLTAAPELLSAAASIFEGYANPGGAQ
ncbi:MAG: tyrosine-type recombinase/integrase [Candidatus Solibacter sp.]